MGKKIVQTETGYKVVEVPDTPKHFFFMGPEQRKLVADWHNGKEGATDRQKDFLERVKTAIETITYDYSIATIEPSQDENGKICYEVGKPVLRGLSYNEWEQKAKEFMPEMGSDIATLPELDLWYAYRIASGKWTLKYVCDNSSRAGNYWNSPNAFHDFEVSGKREVGGFADGVGNTYKIVKDLKSGFWLCGGNFFYNGYDYPVADAYHLNNTDNRHYDSSGCIGLKK